jgi:hypothetical protein
VEDVLNELLGGSVDYQSLRPDVWASSHPDSIRAHRQKEREANNIRRERDRLRRRLARLEKWTPARMVTSGAYVACL